MSLDMCQLLTGVDDGYYEPNIVLSRENREEYRQASLAKLEQFRQDALLVCGLLNHHKSDAIWEKAWSIGHGNGLRDVLFELDDLAHLLA